jgi:hypothetical protein
MCGLQFYCRWVLIAIFLVIDGYEHEDTAATLLGSKPSGKPKR